MRWWWCKNHHFCLNEPTNRSKKVMMLNLHKGSLSLTLALLFPTSIYIYDSFGHLISSTISLYPLSDAGSLPVECARSMSAVSVSSSSCSSIYPKFVFRFSFIVRPDSRKKEYIFICNVYYIPAKTNTARFPFLQMLMGARIMSSSHCMYLG